MKTLAFLWIVLLASTASAAPPYRCEPNTENQLAMIQELCEILRTMPRIDDTTWNEDRCASEAMILGFLEVNRLRVSRKDQTARAIQRKIDAEFMLNPEFNGVGIGLPPEP